MTTTEKRSKYTLDAKEIIFMNTAAKDFQFLPSLKEDLSACIDNQRELGTLDMNL